MTSIRLIDRVMRTFGTGLLIALTLFAVLPVAQGEVEPASEWMALTGGPSLDAWQKDQRGWSLAGEVKLNAENARRLVSTPGDVVLLSKGDAVN